MAEAMWGSFVVAIKRKLSGAFIIVATLCGATARAPLSAMPSEFWHATKDVSFSCAITGIPTRAQVNLCDAVRRILSLKLKRPLSTDPATPGALRLSLRGTVLSTGQLLTVIAANRASLRGESGDMQRRQTATYHYSGDITALGGQIGTSFDGLFPSPKPRIRSIGKMPPRAHQMKL